MHVLAIVRATDYLYIFSWFGVPQLTLFVYWNWPVQMRTMSLQFRCNNTKPVNREKKKYTPPPWDPLFSVCRPTPRSQSKKNYGVYHFLGKTREKGIHHRTYGIGPERRVYTIEPQTRKKKKRRVSTVVVYTFSGKSKPGFF